MKMLSSTLVLAIGLVALTGCEKSGPPSAKRARVSGTVKWNGKPLASGTITFDARNGQAPASFTILDGAYEGMVAIGVNKVTITSFRTTSMREKMGFDGPGYDQPVEENILPARYSSESKIEKEVIDPGPNEFNFDLKKD